MILITEQELLNWDSKVGVPVRCEHCGGTFYIEKRRAKAKFYGKTYGKKSRYKYCSARCSQLSQVTAKTLNCTQCGKEFTRGLHEVKKSNNHFCGSSCAATYNNTHKTSGYRRSKLEKYIEEQLSLKYPNLEIHYNRKDTINSELDIYIPSLKLAFELNGIFHYEPIYGEDKLNRVKNNDLRKFQACLENKIELCIIDTHNVKYLKKERDNKFLNIVTEIIDGKLVNN